MGGSNVQDNEGALGSSGQATAPQVSPLEATSSLVRDNEALPYAYLSEQLRIAKEDCRNWKICYDKKILENQNLKLEFDRLSMFCHQLQCQETERGQSRMAEKLALGDELAKAKDALREEQDKHTQTLIALAKADDELVQKTSEVEELEKKLEAQERSNRHLANTIEELETQVGISRAANAITEAEIEVQRLEEEVDSIINAASSSSSDHAADIGKLQDMEGGLVDQMSTLRAEVEPFVNWDEELCRRFRQLGEQCSSLHDRIGNRLDHGTVQCAICLSDLCKADAHWLSLQATSEGCDHFFHKGCIKEYLSNKIKDPTSYPLKCCGLDSKGAPCKTEINEDHIMIFLAPISDGLLGSFRKHSLTAGNSLKLISCLNSKCSAEFEWGDSDDAVAHNIPVTCYECGYRMRPCCNIRLEDHEDISCDEVQRRRRLADVPPGCTLCPGRTCGAIVEKNRGCNHMTCRCKTEFCYLCGVLVTSIHVAECNKNPGPVSPGVNCLHYQHHFSNSHLLFTLQDVLHSVP
mmetsp:Transcript_32332/g.54488  ORF Transcript_32332/g.54488 Transcript_32332/m.54488 type:complete len:522 (+) Transcript_32332:136-1701(+)